MDTSEQYINMCRKARELQEMWKPSQGDWFVLYDEIENIGDYSEDLHPIDYRDEFPISKKNCIWLPRIDQLATLYDSDWARFCNMCEFIDTHNIVSFEQAGLMAVMERQYKKEWNGEDWI